MKDIPSSQIRALDRAQDRAGFYILSGCASDAVSYETSVYGQGLLTYSILKAMKGDKLRTDGGEEYVDVAMLCEYAVDQVPKLAEGIGGIQKPFYKNAGNGDQRSFDIGRMNSEDKNAILISDPKPVFMPAKFVNTDIMGREINIDAKINAVLREISAKGKTSEVIFTEGIGYPNSFQIKGNYSIDNNKLDVKFAIAKGGSIIGSQLSANGKVDELDSVITEIIEKSKKAILNYK
jgi:hypothetical protein